MNANGTSGVVTFWTSQLTAFFEAESSGSQGGKGGQEGIV